MNTINQLTLAQIVNNNYLAVRIFEKYHLNFCCKGKRRLEQACIEQQLSVSEIINELETLIATGKPGINFDEMSLTQLCNYILHTHHTYVNKKMPQILYYLLKVSAKHGENHAELYKIFELFTTVKEDMESHIRKEELILFPRIKELQNLNEQKNTNFQVNINYLLSPITTMEQEHDHAGSLLNEIRILSKDYNPPADACTSYRLSFALLQDFELDLHLHVHLENNILFPKSISMFKEVAGSVLN